MLPDDVLHKVMAFGHQIRVRSTRYIGRVNTGDQRFRMLLRWSHFFLETEVATKNRLVSMIWENRLVKHGPYEVLLSKIIRDDSRIIHRTAHLHPKETPTYDVAVDPHGNLQYCTTT